MGKGHHWELCLWRLYLVPGPFLSLCFLAAIMDAELFYPDLPGLRSLSLWPKPQLWNQAAEQRLEETKNNSLCKTQKGLWLPKREVGIQQKQGFAFLDTLAEGEKSNRSPQWKWVFPGDCFPRDPGGGGSQRHLALTALLYHRQLSLCCCQTDWDILQTLYSPYTHLWFEYGKKKPRCTCWVLGPQLLCYFGRTWWCSAAGPRRRKDSMTGGYPLKARSVPQSLSSLCFLVAVMIADLFHPAPWVWSL